MLRFQPQEVETLLSVISHKHQSLRQSQKNLYSTIKRGEYNKDKRKILVQPTRKFK
jgi:hypothetical protein